MKVKAKKAFISTIHGNVVKGVVLNNVRPELAKQWSKYGLVELIPEVAPQYETKVIVEKPQAGGMEEPSSAQPPARHYRKRRSTTSEEKQGWES